MEKKNNERLVVIALLRYIDPISTYLNIIVV